MGGCFGCKAWFLGTFWSCFCCRVLLYEAWLSLLPAVGLRSRPSAELLFSSWGSTLTHRFPPSLLAFIFSCFLLGNTLNAPLPSVAVLCWLCSLVIEVCQPKRLCYLPSCRAHRVQDISVGLYEQFFFSL